MGLWYPKWYPKNSGYVARAQRMGGELVGSWRGRQSSGSSSPPEPDDPVATRRRRRR